MIFSIYLYEASSLFGFQTVEQPQLQIRKGKQRVGQPAQRESTIRIVDQVLRFCLLLLLVSVKVMAVCLLTTIACCQQFPECNKTLLPAVFYHQWAPEDVANWRMRPTDSYPLLSRGLLDDQVLDRLGNHKKALESHPKSGEWWTGDFSHSDFSGEDLRHIVFVEADLTAASFFWKSNLEGASFYSGVVYEQPAKAICYSSTRLDGAIFAGTDLKSADFGETSLAHVVFEPSDLPEAAEIASAQNLEQLTFLTNPSGLVQLRKSFRDSGFARQARQVTYAIKRRENEIDLLSCCPSCRASWPIDNVNPLYFGRQADLPAQELWNRGSYGQLLQHCIKYAINRVALDLTCQYGLNVLRPIEIGAVIWLSCAVVFLGFIHHPGSSGLYIVRAEGIVLDADAIKNADQIRPRPAASLRAGVWRELGLLRMAMLFSLVNGFNLGFKEIDLGRWLRLLTRREMEIRAAGWARTVAGVQALSTLGLVALWIIVTFATPFD